MYYIVYDLEFNQDFTSVQENSDKKASYPFEIIQIGAAKINQQFDTVAYFNRYVKPSIYSKVSPFITELTGITTEQLLHEASFPEVYHEFLAFTESFDSVFCIWGKTDIKELYRSVSYHNLDLRQLPRQYIDLQPYASLHLKQPKNKLLRLQYTVEALELPKPYPFHNAVNDAYYTAELFKKIMKPGILPEIYDPSYRKPDSTPRQPKKTIDFDALLQQFEKMYQRPMTEEEQGIIKLAYQMGKTGQFVKNS